MKRMSIHNSEEKYRRLIETTSEGYWLISLQFETLDVNRALTEMLGYEREEMLGKSIFDFVDDENKRIWTSSTAKIAEQDHRSYEIILQRKSGEEVACFFNATTVRDKAGKVEGSFAFVTDITERKRFEEALKGSQRQLADIINFLPDATLVIDTNGKVIFWNYAIEEMTGIKAADMIGKGNYEYAIPFYGERRPILVDLVLLPNETLEEHYSFIRREKNWLTVEAEVPALRGEKRFTFGTAAPIFNLKGEIVGAIESIRDLTDRRRAEVALQEYRQHLEEMIEKRTMELKLAKEAAEAAANTKSEFLANMSHEIRTPMNAIIGFSGLALKTDLTAKQYDYIKKIDIAAKSLLGIINDVLDFSKIEAGRLEMESTDFQLDDVMNNIVNIISVAAAKKGIELLSTIAEDVPRALIGDPLRLGQVLINLANNAVKFTESGNIFIKAELVNKDSKFCQIKFGVRDSGIGMTPEQIGKLFTAFSQADTSVTRKYGGTGLGLTISKCLVERMNGEISVESSPGEGSLFSFTARFIRQSEEREYSRFTPADFAELKVLIVDDNELAREVLTEQIKSFGLEAVSVESGEKAINELHRAAADKSYDLVLMDWQMPVMDGIETAKIILKDNMLGHTPLIIMVSAFGREEVMKRAEKAGINAFLMKPVNQSLLFDTLMESFGHNVSSNTDFRSLPRSNLKITERMAGAKVLLVEDNQMNQQVAMEILMGAGLTVDIANNGQEAIDAVAESDYDLVLMDVQMPVMGGYEATRLIKADDRHARLPIIAMTAHVMQGVREECLAAGMNDYVSKPIDPEQMFLVLSRWLKGHSLAPEIKAREQNVHLIGLDSENFLPEVIMGIDLVAGLKRLNYNEKLYKQLLADFAEKYASYSDQIKDAYYKGDYDFANRLSHTLKGVAGNLSINKVYDTAWELEEALAQRFAPEIDRLLIELEQQLQMVTLELRQLHSNKEKEVIIQESALNIEEIRALLFKLAKLLDEDNLDAGQCLESLKEGLGTSIYQNKMQELDGQVASYDFDAAKQSLRKIILAMEKGEFK